MPITLNCQCGKTLTVADEYAGKQGKCPACGAVVNIPAAAPPIMAPPPLQYATPGIAAASGPIAPPPADAVPIPHAVTPKHQRPALPPCFVIISSEGADVQSDFDLTRVMQGLADGIAAKLKNRYNVVMGAAIVPNAPTLFLRIVEINPGSRWMRYFFGIFAGGAIFEIVGRVTTPQGQAVDIRARRKAVAGLFGGNSENLLKTAATAAGKLIGKKALKAI